MRNMLSVGRSGGRGASQIPAAKLTNDCPTTKSFVLPFFCRVCRSVHASQDEPLFSDIMDESRRSRPAGMDTDVQTSPPRTGAPSKLRSTWPIVAHQFWKWSAVVNYIRSANRQHLTVPRYRLNAFRRRAFSDRRSNFVQLYRIVSAIQH